MTPRPPRPDIDVVIPTIGRPSLDRLLASLDRELGQEGAVAAPRTVIVVDDRPVADEPLAVEHRAHLAVDVVRAGGLGPAASRNRGWHRSRARWVCFLDDDVVVRPGWLRRLADDLTDAAPDVGAVQGRVHVPLPADRRPTDRERNVAGLATASWITADMAVRRTALLEIGGFDERFRRAYREDADLALRLLDAGWGLQVGTRAIDHPVGPAPWTVSICAQRGNADDALMDRLHGVGWRQRAGAPRGALRRHVAATATATAAFAAAAAGQRRPAAALGAAWAAQWIAFAARRIAPGPRDAGEVAAMAVTSAALAPAAVAWAVRGRIRARRSAPVGTADRWHTRTPKAVLLDRDGTLVHDVPYNGDPDLVEPVPGARQALDRLRAAGMAVALVSNQSGVARGHLTAEQVEAVNARTAQLLGPFDSVQWCPHGPDDGCACRKPATGMLDAAAADLGVAPVDCAFVGDIGSDVEAGLAAGARPVLVPTAVTRAAEVEVAPEVAASLTDAVDALLGGGRLPAGHQLAPAVVTATVIEEWAS
jgi:histidinol-phosphate phosphatase family protein